MLLALWCSTIGIPPDTTELGGPRQEGIRYYSPCHAVLLSRWCKNTGYPDWQSSPMIDGDRSLIPSLAYTVFSKSLLNNSFSSLASLHRIESRFKWKTWAGFRDLMADDFYIMDYVSNLNPPENESCTWWFCFVSKRIQFLLLVWRPQPYSWSLIYAHFVIWMRNCTTYSSSFSDIVKCFDNCGVFSDN